MRIQALTILSTLTLASAARAQSLAKTRWDSVAHDIFKELVEVNTTESSGSSARAAHAMAARLKAAGFPDSDVVGS